MFRRVYKSFNNNKIQYEKKLKSDLQTAKQRNNI